MKITFVGHASILIQTAGLSILSDPWWRGPCFGAQWWNYPAPFTEALEGVHVDYVYISHGHHDHYHPGTLKTLKRDAKILVSRELDLAEGVRELGFEAIEVGDDAELRLNEQVGVRIMSTPSSDSLLALSDGAEVCVNLNDALHSAPVRLQDAFIRRLRQLYPRIDYLFCGYGVASHFPNCYIVPGKDPERTAARRQHYFNRQWCRIVDRLNPRFGLPFAADVVFLEDDLMWVNEPTHNAERPVELFRAMHPDSQVKLFDIAPGFIVEHGEVISARLRTPVRVQALRESLGVEIARANRYASVEPDKVEEVLRLVRRNIELCGPYLASYSGGYRFLIRFRNSACGIRIEKRDRVISAAAVQTGTTDDAGDDLVYRVRLPYLMASLTTPYGAEILFVGSGGVFEYSDRERARENLHRELMVIMRMHATPPSPRPAKAANFVQRVKHSVKRLLGRLEPDLYDVYVWSVFDGAGTTPSHAAKVRAR